jgi:hypothetical protein
VIEDGEPVALDLVAWPVNLPEAFATLSGAADGLGIEAADNPATFFAGKALRLHRTPLGWLRSVCTGSVILNPQCAVGWLGDAPGRIACDDPEHAREVSMLLHPYVAPARVGILRRAA